MVLDVAVDKLLGILTPSQKLLGFIHIYITITIQQLICVLRYARYELSFLLVAQPIKQRIKLSTLICLQLSYFTALFLYSKVISV